MYNIPRVWMYIYVVNKNFVRTHREREKRELKDDALQSDDDG